MERVDVVQKDLAKSKESCCKTWVPRKRKASAMTVEMSPVLLIKRGKSKTAHVDLNELYIWSSKKLLPAWEVPLFRIASRNT